MPTVAKHALGGLAGGALAGLLLDGWLLIAIGVAALILSRQYSLLTRAILAAGAAAGLSLAGESSAALLMAGGAVAYSIARKT